MRTSRFAFTSLTLFLAASLACGGTAAIADSDTSQSTDVEALVEAGSGIVDLAEVDDDSAVAEVDVLLGEVELPAVAEELIGTSIDVDVLSAVADDVEILAVDGGVLAVADIPSLDVSSGEVSLPTGDVAGDFSIRPAASGETEKAGAATVTELDGVDVSVVSQVTENLEAQLIAVVDDESVDYIDFAVEVPDGFTLTPVYGGFILENEFGELGGWIKPAWALDAEGTALVTNYEVLPGGIIRQTINTSGATFPIVADPQAKISGKNCWLITGYGIAHSTAWSAIAGATVAGPVGIAAGAAASVIYGGFWAGVGYACSRK